MLRATTVGDVVGAQLDTCRTFADVAAVLFDGFVLFAQSSI